MGWDGPLFRGRFRNRVVQDEDYWRHLFAYVLTNPVRSGFDEVGTAEPWTSRAAVLGGHDHWWVTAREFDECFGSVGAYLEYERCLLAGTLSGPPEFDGRRLWSPHVSGFLGPWKRFVRPTPTLHLKISNHF